MFNNKKYDRCDLSHEHTYRIGDGCEDFLESDKPRFMEPPVYIDRLEGFLRTGVFDATDFEDDALGTYLSNICSTPLVRIQVLQSDIQADIFRNVMLRFIYSVADRQKVNQMMTHSDMHHIGESLVWSNAKKHDGWQALLKMAEERFNQYGFDSHFYQQQMQNPQKVENKELWQKMYLDMRSAIMAGLHQKTQDVIQRQDEQLQKQLKNYLGNIPDYLEKHHVEKEEFQQAWGMMNGLWNEQEFERLLRVVRIQAEYPEIAHIAGRMGRTTSDDGAEWMSLSQGQTQQIEHSTHSDILGVTQGNDLGGLLPLEMAMLMDNDTENLFYRKYFARRLQVFRFKSEVVKPARHLDVKPVVRRGPMIVCVDTSGSMIGKPEKISHSALIKLLDICRRQRRSCFIITFSVSAKPIDVTHEPHKVLNMFSHSNTGDTNATQMMQKTFELLESDARFVNADVMWITDFRIPPVADKLIQHWHKLHSEGTRFYGLQIGMADHNWHQHFDEIARIGYVPGRNY